MPTTAPSREIVQWVLSVLVSALMALIYVVYQDITEDMRHREERVAVVLRKVEEATLEMARSRSDLNAHLVEANYWKAKIDVLDERVDELSNSVAARPDPFTGTQGQALSDRIGRLESQLDRHISADEKKLKGH